MSNHASTIRTSRVAGGIVLTALLSGLLGCGSLDPRMAPVEAETVDFCKAYARVATADADTSAEDLNDYLLELARFGTPSGTPTAARNGFEYLIDPERDFANGAEVAALATSADEVGQNVNALGVFARQICRA